MLAHHADETSFTSGRAPSGVVDLKDVSSVEQEGNKLLLPSLELKATSKASADSWRSVLQVEIDRSAAVDELTDTETEGSDGAD